MRATGAAGTQVWHNALGNTSLTQVKTLALIETLHCLEIL